MRSRDFVFWLQGLFEVGNPTALNEQQVAVIKQHLGLVFAHDPEMRAPVHQPVTTIPNSFRPVPGTAGDVPVTMPFIC